MHSHSPIQGHMLLCFSLMIKRGRGAHYLKDRVKADLWAGSINKEHIDLMNRPKLLILRSILWICN
jgi:hypothetical protein